MRTLQDVLDKLDGMDIDADEVPISRAAFNYLIQQAKEVLAAEEEEEYVVNQRNGTLFKPNTLA